MICGMAGDRHKQALMMYETYRPRYKILTFEQVVSGYLRDVPMELDSRHGPFKYTDSDQPLYLYPRHAVTLAPFTYLERLDSQMPISVGWPPDLHCVPSFNFHMDTTPTMTMGPFIEYVFILLSVRHLYATATSVLMKTM